MQEERKPAVNVKRFTLKQLIDRIVHQLTGTKEWRLERRKGRMEVQVEVPKSVDSTTPPG